MNDSPDKILTIAKWADTFENADTRKRQRLKCYLAPSGCDSSGYVELLTCHGSAGLLAFGIFHALCQHAATMPAKSRGKFVRSNGSAMSLRQIALLIRVEICHLEEAVQLLTSEDVSWLKWEQANAQSATNLPPVCHPTGTQSARSLPPTAGFVQGEGEVEGQVEGEGDGGKTPSLEAPSKPSKATKSNPFEDRFPKAQAAEFERITKHLNACNPRWRPQLTRMEMDALQANVWVLSEIVDSDWNLLRAYMHADIDPGLGKFWQPDGRLKMIESITDVLTHAEKWKTACRRAGIPTGLEPDRKIA
jgi:hypothetical protein